jgi:hypothetical protein
MTLKQDFRLPSLSASMFEKGDLPDYYSQQASQGYGEFGTALSLDRKITIGSNSL